MGLRFIKHTYRKNLTADSYNNVFIVDRQKWLFERNNIRK